MKTHEMLNRVRQTVKAHRMLGKGDHVLAAVSGGADSVVMLHVLLALKDEMKLGLTVFHLNHNLRGEESAADHTFVRRLSKRLGLPFEVRKLRAGELSGSGSSLQEAARDARYRHLKEAAAVCGAKRVALGHTLDDQAETVLLRLVKGGGAAGLSGIPPVRGPFVRPLIDVARLDVEAYAAAAGLRFRTDSTNLVAKYLRNDIRLNLIPYLRERFNPNITASLARLSSILREESDFIEQAAHSALHKALIGKDKDSVVLDRASLSALHAAVKARVLMKAFWLLTGETDIYSTHIMSSMRLVDGRKPNASISLPGGVSILRAYDRVVLSACGKPPAPGFSVPLKVPGTTVIKAAGYSFKARLETARPTSYDPRSNTACFDAASFLDGGPYVLRPMAPGDRMVPFGMKGRKKVKDLLMENKVPAGRRSAVPMLCSGDEVVWAVGIRQSQRHRVVPGTKKILTIEFKTVAEAAQ